MLLRLGMLRVILSTGLITGIVAGAPAQADTGHIDEAVAQLPGIIEQIQTKTGVPGIAVAVVHDDKVVYSGGFGVRNTKGTKPVTPETVFQIASVSKSLGASVVAAAVGKGNLRWHAPVRRFLPGFELSQRYPSRNVTVADFYSHRSGLPGNTGNELESFGFGRKTIINRMRYVPLAPLRVTYSYSNFGMTVGGEAAAIASGTTWERLADRMVFGPLGMDHTSYRHSDFVRQSNRAALHQQVGGKWVPSAKRQPDAQAPAGGASSTVLDMAKWLRMQLADGRFDGEQVVARGPLREARSLQIRTSPRSADASDIRGYAFGMNYTLDGTGRVRWGHSGAFSAGAATNYLMIPSLNLGIVVLTNGWPIGVPEAITETFADIAETGSSSRDWLPILEQAFAPYTTANKTAFGRKKPADPKPARSLASYVGTYRNAYVGRSTVARAGQRLVLRLGPNGQRVLRLRHWTADTFVYTGIDLPKGFTAGVRFDPRAGTMQIEEVEGDLGLLSRVG
jgi:CubicO group peptidase (beta-lactamase class C family)